VGRGYTHRIPSGRHNAGAAFNLESPSSRQQAGERCRVAIVDRNANLASII
jgi:hypothetical protein